MTRARQMRVKSARHLQKTRAREMRVDTRCLPGAHLRRRIETSRGCRQKLADDVITTS